MNRLLLYLALSLIWLPGQAGAVELYERSGEPPVILTPAPEADRPDLAVDHYRKAGGALVGVARGIIIKTTAGLDLQPLLADLELSRVKVLGPDMVLVETADRSLTLDTVHRLNQTEGVLYSHPDYVRRIHPR